MRNFLSYYVLDIRFGFLLTVLTITEEASLSSGKLISLSSLEEIFSKRSFCAITLLRSYAAVGASSQEGEELLLSIVATPNCCLSVPSLNNVAYSDSKICLA